jgi:hypothetical protein
LQIEDRRRLARLFLPAPFFQTTAEDASRSGSHQFGVLDYQHRYGFLKQAVRPCFQTRTRSSSIAEKNAMLRSSSAFIVASVRISGALR